MNGLALVCLAVIAVTVFAVVKMNRRRSKSAAPK